MILPILLPRSALRPKEQTRASPWTSICQSQLPGTLRPSWLRFTLLMHGTCALTLCMRALHKHSLSFRECSNVMSVPGNC